MKMIFTFITSLCIVSLIHAQITPPYIQNFNSGVPGNWTSQGNNGAPGWSVVSGVATVTVSSTTGCSSWLYTPVFNTNGVPDPVVVYRINMTPTDFCSPLLFLKYTTDGGSTYQNITSFGVDNNCATPTNYISAGQWYYYYSPLPHHSNLLIAFEAEYYFLGYGSMYLDDFEVRDLNATGIAESDDVGIEVFPNPASDRIMIRSGTRTLDRYAITDMAGRVIQDGRLPSDGQVDLGSGMGSGCYLLTVTDDHGQRLSRIIVKQ